MSTSSVISSYLPHDTQLEVIQKLFDENQLDQALDIIQVFQIDLDSHRILIFKIFAKFENKIYEIFEKTSVNDWNDAIVNDEEFNLLVTFITKSENLKKLFNNWICEKLNSLVNNHNTRLFDPETQLRFVTKLVPCSLKVEEVESPFMEDEFLRLLNLLETIFLSFDVDLETENDKTTDTLNQILIALLFCDNEPIALLCSKLMRWRHQQIAQMLLKDEHLDNLVWELIRSAYSQRDIHDWKERDCLTLILRILGSGVITKSFISFMKTEEYWKFLQLALNHTIHERRKLGLSILNLTIKSLTENDFGSFATELFQWDCSKKEQLEESWKRYTTLYEIVAIDTALNQIQAARSDIINLFNDKNVEASWGIILFATGLKASMESVRKYMMLLMFQIKDMSIFSANLTLLRSTLLPSVMLAFHYKAETSAIEQANADVCEYGEVVTDFFKDILIGSGNKTEETLTEILNLLIDFGTAFDPARIYASLGVYKYLSLENSKLLNASQLILVKKLFEFEAEDPVFETTMKSIYARFLNFVDEDSVSPIEWIECLGVHLKRCTCSFSHFGNENDSFDIIPKTLYQDKMNEILSNIGQDCMFDIISTINFNLPILDLNTEILLLLPNILDYKKVLDEKLINDAVSENIISLLNMSEDDVKYKNAHKLITLYDNLITIDAGQLISKITKEFSLNKFNFVSAVIGKYSQREEVNEDLLDLYQVILSYFKSSKDKFEIRDQTYASFFNIFVQLIERDILVVEPVYTDKLLKLAKSNIDTDNNHYSANLAITKLCTLIHTRSRKTSCFDIISTIWENINDERLILKEIDLHILLIENIFNEENLKLAFKDEGSELQFKIKEYGLQVASLGYSRRQFLPKLAELLCNFVKSNNLDGNSKGQFSWFIELLIAVLIQPQMEQNIFQLKSVIGLLYDRTFNDTTRYSLYSKVFGEPEIYARVYIIIAVLYSNESVKSGIIEYLTNNGNMLYSKKRIDGPEERERLLKWQISLLAMRSMRSQINNFDKFNMEDILKSIEFEASPLVRIYKEWFIGYYLAESYAMNTEVSSIEECLLEWLNDHSKPTLLVSAERIFFIVLSSSKESCNRTLLKKYLCSLIPNATSNKPLVRHFSNSLMLSFWPTFQDLLSDDSLGPVVGGLYLNAKQTQIVGQYRAGDANIWHLYDDLTLTGIFGNMIRKITDHDAQYISAHTFEKVIGNGSHCNEFPIGEDETYAWLDKREGNTVGKKKPMHIQLDDSDVMSPLQKKSGAWETILDIDNKKQTSSVRRSELIVVASLVDKPPNLGGICRLCDVLGVGLVTVDDIKVKNHPQFKNVAVTADKWMPMKEVPTGSIIEFMREKKKEGYTLIGLEQTDKSVKLDENYRFPKKSLMLLGTEAHGIPGHLLSELDLCLEIQQFGVIRSMNIQTATAVIVHSYTIQHM